MASVTKIRNAHSAIIYRPHLCHPARRYTVPPKTYEPTYNASVICNVHKDRKDVCKPSPPPPNHDPLAPHRTYFQGAKSFNRGNDPRHPPRQAHGPDKFAGKILVWSWEWAWWTGKSSRVRFLLVLMTEAKGRRRQLMDQEVRVLGHARLFPAYSLLGGSRPGDWKGQHVGRTKWN